MRRGSGLFYTPIVGPLTESIASAVGHVLNPVAANSLDFLRIHIAGRHMRPIVSLLLAG
jgi:hypothetical protein